MQHAFSKFKKDPDRYNHGEPGYAEDVYAIGDMLTTYSPEIKEYMRQHNIKGEGGSLTELPQWDELSMREKAAYIGVAVKNGMRDLPAIRRMYNEFAKGGYMPSEEMRKKIAEWEGSSMATNRPFDLEARDFERALPDDIRYKVLSNPQLADYLYSYSYNVGSGNFRKRVVPALRSYYSGDGSVDDITRSMWASGDKKLRGLARRRAWERDGVRDALRNTEMERVSRMIDNSAHTPVFIPTEPEPMVEGFIPVPKDVPEQTVQPSRQEQPKESTGRYMDLQELMTAQDMLRFPIGETTITAPSASYPTNSPYIVRVYDVGGSLSGDDGQEKRTMLVREKNGHPVSYDEEGYLTDQVTGEKGTMLLPEVTVRPGEYRSAFEPTAFTDYLGRMLRPIEEATAAVVPYDYEKYLTIASPTRLLNTVWTAIKGDAKAPWNPANHGIFSELSGDDPMSNGLDFMTDLVLGPKMVKGELKGIGSTDKGGKALYSSVKTVRDNGTIWDSYTTAGGRLGNWGDTFLDRVWGTTARRFNLPDKARIPGDAMRKLSENIRVKDGLADFTGNLSEYGEPHVNFTLDRPVVSHPSGNWNTADLYIMPTNSLIRQSYPNALKSIEPSDTFIHGSNITEPVGNVTLISGDTEALNWARHAGMNTLSSPRLRRLYKGLHTRWEEELKNYNREKAELPEWFKSPDAPKNSIGRGWLDPEDLKYAAEIQRLQSTRGTPTLSDFHALEQATGMDAGVSPLAGRDASINALSRMSSFMEQPISNWINEGLPTYTYPNGRTVEGTPKTIKTELQLLENSRYNKVFYDPTSNVELIWITRHK